jgi:hypothetical protein
VVRGPSTSAYGPHLCQSCGRQGLPCSTLVRTNSEIQILRFHQSNFIKYTHFHLFQLNLNNPHLHTPYTHPSHTLHTPHTHPSHTPHTPFTHPTHIILFNLPKTSLTKFKNATQNQALKSNTNGLS